MRIGANWLVGESDVSWLEVEPYWLLEYQRISLKLGALFSGRLNSEPTGINVTLVITIIIIRPPPKYLIK